VATSSGSPASVWWWEIEEVEVVVEKWRTRDGRTWKRRDCGLGSETEDREARGWIGSSEAERGRSTERTADPIFFSTSFFLVVRLSRCATKLVKRTRKTDEICIGT
jgi:hypothetical protein